MHLLTYLVLLTYLLSAYLLTYVFNYYLIIHLLSQSLTHSLTFLRTYLFTYSCTYSLTHSLTYLLTYPLTHLLTLLLTHLLTFPYPPIIARCSDDVVQFEEGDVKDRRVRIHTLKQEHFVRETVFVVCARARILPLCQLDGQLLVEKSEEE